VNKRPAPTGDKGGLDVKKAAVIVVLGLAVIAVGIQLVPVSRTNPPVVADFDGPADVRAVFRKSCYDCHSNETRWPWYSRVAPSSWLVTHDVEEARDHFNFSLWGTYSADKQAHLAEDIWDEVKDGDMPLLIYRLAHRGVTPSDADKMTVERWSRAVGGEN